MTDDLTIRPLHQGELIPYGLLLLADEEKRAIDRYLSRSVIYVAEIVGKIIGVYVLYPVDDHIAEIKAIAVDEPYQNRGIGKLMLQDAENKARKNGFTELLIGTPTVAQKQLAIYQKAGFEWFAVKKDFFITNYSAPIFEDNIQLKDMAILKKRL